MVYHMFFIERLIKRWASEFVEDIHLKIDGALGEFILTGLKLKPGTFEHAEHLLDQLGVDIWNTWDKNGMSTIFPHAVEVTSGTIKHVRVKLPMPNPFNGENWIITVDGVEGTVCTLSERRRLQLLKTSRSRALQSAERRYAEAAEAEPHKGLPEKDEVLVEKHVVFKHADSRASSDFTDDDARSVDDSMLKPGYAERFQKRIDAYFRKHLELNFTNTRLRFNIASDSEYPRAHWDIGVGAMSLDLGVGDIELPSDLTSQIMMANCAYGRGVPEDKKYISEMLGMEWTGVSVSIRADEKLPPVLSLDFPGRAFDLHIVKRQWQESCRTATNGHDRIKVTLPDDFTVGVHWDLGGLRVGLLRMLHHVFDGITVAVPDFADWLSTPWPGSWDRSGKYVPRPWGHKPEDPPPACDGAQAEVVYSARSISKSQVVGHQPTDIERATRSLRYKTDLREAIILGEEYMHLLTKAFSKSEMAFGQSGPMPDAEGEPSGSAAASPTGVAGWWQYITKISTQCTGCTAGCPLPRRRDDDDVVAATHRELMRLHEIEATISLDWLAYWRHKWRSKTGVVAPSVEFTPRRSEGEMPTDHMPWEPSRRWYVAPWRRHEVTLIGASRILVSLTAGKNLAEVMQVTVNKGMKVVLVRDQPADWHIWAKVPFVRIRTEMDEWLSLPQLTASMVWSPSRFLQPSKLELAGLPSDVDNQVPSLCCIRAKIERMSVKVCPAVVKRWVPLLGELPSVPEWPELRYFWGEWGYMARPMAYLVEALSIGGVHFSVMRHMHNGGCSPRSLKAARVAKASYTASKAIGSFDVTLGPTMISTGAVFIDRTWAMVGSLQIALRELRVLGIREKNASTFVYIPSLYLKVNREAGARGVNMVVDLHRFNMLLAVVPLLLTVFTIEAYFNVLWEEAAHMRLALVQLKKLYHVIMEMTWLWPLSFRVTSPESAPVKIQVADRVQSTVQVIASFALSLVVKNPAKLDDVKRCVQLSIDPCKVELWYYNMTVCQDWEPLLEPWSLSVGLECDAPPQASFSLAIMGFPDDTLALNVTADLLRVARSLAISWWPVLSRLIRRRPRLSELHNLDITIPMNVLNLTGGSVSIKVHHLPQTESDVAIKVQSILRGRVARRKAKGNLGRTVTRDIVGGTGTRSDELFSFASAPVLGRLRILRPASLESCDVAESQRLHINVIQMRALPRNHAAPTMATETSVEAKAVSSVSVAPWRCCGSLPQETTPRRSSVGGLSAVGLSKVKVVALDEIKTETFDRTALMDLAKHNIKVMWDTTGRDFPLASFVAETISPTRSTRLLVIDSPVRIFNYTDRAVELAFLCYIDGDSMIAVDDRMAAGCTFRASVLGDSQPIESAVYLAHERSLIQLTSETFSAARSQDQKTPRSPYNVAMHSAKSELPGGSASGGAWVLPAGCFASVPAVCRTEFGGVSFTMRFQGSQEWGPMYGVDTLEDDRGLSTYYWESREEACRIFTKSRHMRENSTVKEGGKQLYRCDIIIMPLFSVANALPCGLQAKLHSKYGEQVLAINSAKVVHVYTLTAGDVSCFTDMTMQLRFDQDASKWSKDLTRFYNPLPPEYSQGGDKPDIQVKISFSDGVASSELVVRCGDVCVVSCPVWLVDKSGLNLRCTDNESKSFPFVEPYYLLDSTTADNYLVIDCQSARELNYKRVVEEGEAVSNDGDEENMLLTEASVHIALPTQKLSLPFTQRDVAMVALPKSVSRQTALVQLTGKGENWTNVKAFPLGVRWEPVRPPFGAARSPQAYVITVQPHIVCTSDTAVKLREVGKDSFECHVQPGTHLPLWFRRSKGARKVCAKFEKSANFSDDILIDRGSVGLHAVAVWDESMQQLADHANSFVFGVLISDEIPGTLMVSFNTEPALLFRNLSADVDEAALLTDHPVRDGTGKSVLFGHGKSETSSVPVHMGNMASLTGHQSGNLDGSSMSEPPRWAFRCGPGETAAAGWYRPFQKGAKPDDVHVYLRWKTGSSVCAKVGLYSWKEMIFVRPRSAYMGLKASERNLTGIRLIQRAKSIIVETFSQPYLNLNGKDSFDLTCGGCGEHLPDEVLAHFRMAHCPKCKEQLYLPLRIDQKDDDDFVQQLSEQLLDVGVWLPFVELKVSLHIPAVSISVCSQQAAPRELVHVFVSGIDIDLGGSLKVSRGMTMDVGGVRVDRQFHSEHSKSTAVVASTLPEGEGDGHGHGHGGDGSSNFLLDLTNVCHTSSKSNERAVPAIHLHVLNVFVTSPTLCLKNLEVDLNHTFEVDLDTDFVNAMFLFGDECLKAVGVECMQLSDLITDEEEVFAFMPPEVILAEAVRHAEEPIIYCLRGYPMAVQTQTFRIGQVNAKVWASLNLFEMELVPKPVARLVQILTLSEVVNLAAAPIQIEEHNFGVQRTSLTGLAHLTLKVYMPELIRIGAHILGSSNLAKMVVAPVRVVAWAASGAMSVFSTTLHAHRNALQNGKSSHSQPDQSQLDEAPKQRRARRRHQILKAKKESKEPAATGLPPIRLPRLLMSKGRLVPYNASHSRLLFAFGTRHAGKAERLDMSSVMLLAELSEHPLTFAILCRDQLAVCSLKGALAHSDSETWSVRASRHSERHQDTAKMVLDAHCKQYPEGTLWGPWSWDHVCDVRVTVSPGESSGGTGEPPKHSFIFEVDLPMTEESLTWKADLLQDRHMLSIRTLAKRMKDTQNYSYRATG